MPDSARSTTVFRSADPTAETDATRVRDRLMEAGIEAVLLNDEAPGVVAGTYEVRVPEGDATRAEQLVAESGREVERTVDASHGLDLVTLFSSQNHDAELEATAIQNILQANDIPAVVVGSQQIPVVPFEVRVPRSRLDEARKVIEEAQAAGPAAAEAAEAASEECT